MKVVEIVSDIPVASLSESKLAQAGRSKGGMDWGEIGGELPGTGNLHSSDPFQNVLGEGYPSFSMSGRIELRCQCNEEFRRTRKTALLEPVCGGVPQAVKQI
jgi:hypothetical protein